MFGFYSPCLRKALDMFSFGLQIHVLSNRNSIAHQNLVGESGFFFSGHLKGEHDYYNVYPLTCPRSKNGMV
jgi:hypothetical protein